MFKTPINRVSASSLSGALLGLTVASVLRLSTAGGGSGTGSISAAARISLGVLLSAGEWALLILLFSVGAAFTSGLPHHYVVRAIEVDDFTPNPCFIFGQSS